MVTETKEVHKNNGLYADEEEITEFGKSCQGRENNADVEVWLQKHKSLYPEEKDQTN